MNYSAAVALVNDKVIGVSCSYEKVHDDIGDPLNRSHWYVFKTFDETIQVDDLVIVPTKGKNGRHGFTIVKVREIGAEFDFDSDIDYEWVVGKVDTTMYEQILEQEEAVILEVREGRKYQRRKELRDAVFAGREERMKHLQLTDLSDNEDEPTDHTPHSWKEPQTEPEF